MYVNNPSSLFATSSTVTSDTIGRTRRWAPVSLQPEYHGCGDFPPKKEAPFGRSVLWAIDFRLDRVDDLMGTTKASYHLTSFMLCCHKKRLWAPQLDKVG